MRQYLMIVSVSAAKFCLTMQKLWFKSKRSIPSPLEKEQNISSLAIQEADEKVDQEVVIPEEGDKKGFLKYFPKSLQKSFVWKSFPSWLFLVVGVGGVIVTTILGLQYLTVPESTQDSNLSCKSKISGDWQTPFGKVTLREESDNLVAAKYEYVNFERGKIVGELTGKLSNKVVIFDWQETPNQQPKQQGKGILIFGQGCKEFSGSYGTGDSTNNFGDWQGSRMSK